MNFLKKKFKVNRKKNKLNIYNKIKEIKNLKKWLIY